MSNIHKIPTQPSLLRRLWRCDATGAMLVIFFVLSMLALGGLLCRVFGVGEP